VSIPTLAAATAAAIFLLAWLRARARNHTLRQQLELARYASGHDRLTGLPNREAAEHAFVHRAFRILPTTLVILDLDHFKRVNDTHGHEIGDMVLIETAQLLTSAAKPYSAMVCRAGGDEFLALIPGRFDAEHVHDRLATVIGDIQAHLTRPITVTTGTSTTVLTVTASAGAAVFDGVHGTFATLLHQADIALYQAKQHRGSCVIHQPGMSMPHTAGRHGPRRRDQHPTDPSHQPSTATGEELS
jgi:diguanylate cyclase (GGDEF)-like protein